MQALGEAVFNGELPADPGLRAAVERAAGRPERISAAGAQPQGAGTLHGGQGSARLAESGVTAPASGAAAADPAQDAADAAAEAAEELVNALGHGGRPPWPRGTLAQFRFEIASSALATPGPSPDTGAGFAAVVIGHGGATAQVCSGGRIVRLRALIGLTRVPPGRQACRLWWRRRSAPSQWDRKQLSPSTCASALARPSHPTWRSAIQINPVDAASHRVDRKPPAFSRRTAATEAPASARSSSCTRRRQTRSLRRASTGSSRGSRAAGRRRLAERTGLSGELCSSSPPPSASSGGSLHER